MRVGGVRTNNKAKQKTIVTPCNNNNIRVMTITITVKYTQLRRAIKYRPQNNNKFVYLILYLLGCSIYWFSGLIG